MGYYVGLDVSLKRTAICVVPDAGEVAWRGSADTHPELIAVALERWGGALETLGLETGSTTPWLARSLKALGLPVAGNRNTGAKRMERAARLHDAAPCVSVTGR